MRAEERTGGGGEGRDGGGEGWMTWGGRDTEPAGCPSAGVTWIGREDGRGGGGAVGGAVGAQAAWSGHGATGWIRASDHIKYGCGSILCEDLFVWSGSSTCQCCDVGIRIHCSQTRSSNVHLSRRAYECRLGRRPHCCAACPAAERLPLRYTPPPPVAFILVCPPIPPSAPVCRSSWRSSWAPSRRCCSSCRA